MRARHLAAVALDEALREADQAPRLGAEEAGRADDLLELGGRGRRERRGVGVAREEPRRHHVDPLVGALRREDRRDGELEGVPVVERAAGLGVRRLEDVEDARGERRGRPERRLAGAARPDFTARGGRPGVCGEERGLRSSRARAAPGAPGAPRTRVGRLERAAAPARGTVAAMRSSSAVGAGEDSWRAARCRPRAGPRRRSRAAPSRNGLSRRAARRASDSAISTSASAVALAVADRRLLLEEGGRRRDGDPGSPSPRASARTCSAAAGPTAAASASASPSATWPSVVEARAARAPPRGGAAGRGAETGLRGEERALVAGQHDQQAARLRPAGGDARREPRGGEAERGVEAEPALELVADRLGRAHRRDGAVRFGGQVDEGLVGGRPLDAAARGEQDRRDLLADAAVGVEVAAPEGRLGAEVPGLRERHARRAPRPARASSLAAATKPIPIRRRRSRPAGRAGRDRGSARPRRRTGRGPRAGCCGVAPSRDQSRSGAGRRRSDGEAVREGSA